MNIIPRITEIPITEGVRDALQSGSRAVLCWMSSSSTECLRIFWGTGNLQGELGTWEIGLRFGILHGVRGKESVSLMQSRASIGSAVHHELSLRAIKRILGA